MLPLEVEMGIFEIGLLRQGVDELGIELMGLFGQQRELFSERGDE